MRTERKISDVAEHEEKAPEKQQDPVRKASDVAETKD
jgi:hypothetical protein